MKKIFTICLLILNIHNLFGQNCNLQFGVTIDYNNRRLTDNYQFYFCSGIPITLTADEIPNATYQWFLDDKEIQGATKLGYSTGSIGGKYTVKAISGSCSYLRIVYLNFTTTLNTFLYSSTGQQSVNICDRNGNIDLYTIVNYTNDFKYQWQKDNIDIDGEENYYYSPQKAGQYTVRVSQGECSTTTQPIEVKTIDLKTHQIVLGDKAYTKDTTLEFCEGIPIRMLSNFGYWDYSEIKAFKDGKQINFNNGDKISESGKYRLELKKGDCMLITPTIDVKFGKNLPQFTLNDWIPGAFNGCGQRVIYFTNSSEISASTKEGDVKIEWRKDGIKQLENPLGAVYTASAPGIYTAVVKSGQCQSETKKFEIKTISSTLVPLRINNINGKKVEACIGQTLALNTVTLQRKQLELYKDGKIIATTKVNDLPKITESGKYYVIAKEENICTQYSDTLEVIIKGVKTLPISLDNSQCQNGIFNLSVEKREGLTYSWKKDGKLIPNANNSTFITKETGNYSVIINQDFCSVASPEIAVGAKIKVNSTICEGQTLQLNAGKAKTYEWKGPNGFSSTLQNPTVSKLSSANQGLYYLNITNDNGCTFRDSVSIKVNQLPIFSVETPEIICLGKAFTITTKTSNNNSVYYNMNTPDNVVFGFGSSLTRDNATPQMAGVYKITATDYDTKCSYTATTKVNINTEADCPSIILADLSKAKICYDTDTDIHFTTSGKFAPNTVFTVNHVDYSGNLIPLASGTKSPIRVKISSYYRLIITSNDRNISSSPSTYLNLSYVYTPRIIYSSQSACTGYSVPLKIDTTYNKFDKVQWKFNGKNIDGATGISYSAKQAGGYSIEVSRDGCIGKSNDTLTLISIGKLEKPYVYPLTSPFACEGFSIDVASSNYLDDVTFQWNLDGKPIEKMNNSTIKASKKGRYSLTVKQGTCEATSDSVQVNIGDILPNRVVGYGGYSSNYDPTKVEICKGSTYQFYYQPYFDRGSYQDSVVRRRGMQLQWQKDGLDIPNADSISYKVEKDGNYRLKISQGSCVAYSKPTQIKFTNKVKLSMSNYSSNAYSTNDKSILACEKDSIQLYFYGGDREQYYLFPTKVYNGNKLIKELPKYNTNFYAANSGNYWITQTYPIKNSEEVCIATSDTLNVKIGGTKIEVLSQNITSCLDTISVYSFYQRNAKYRWRFNDVYLPKDTTESIKIYQSGTYQWEANIKNCQFISKPFTVTFGKLEATLESPYKTVPCYGDVLMLFPQIKSYSYTYDSKTQKQINQPTFQWLKDGVDFSKEEYLENIPKGTYSLTIKQKNCSVTTNPITIDYVKIPREVSPKDSTFFCPNGGFIELASAANSSYKYTWVKDKKVIPNQIKSSIKATETGIYQAQIESGECATMTFPVKVSQKNTPPTALISSTKDNNTGDSTRIKIDLTSSAPWTIKLTNNQTFTAERTPFEFNVKPTQTTIYELASIKNTCGDGTVSGKVEVNMTILGTEEIEGATINLFPVPTQSNCQLTIEMALPEKLEWQLFSSDGKLISKAEKTKIGLFFSQNIDLESLPSGTYLLKIIVGNKIATRKIIKQN